MKPNKAVYFFLLGLVLLLPFQNCGESVTFSSKNTDQKAEQIDDDQNQAGDNDDIYDDDDSDDDETDIGDGGDDEDSDNPDGGIDFERICKIIKKHGPRHRMIRNGGFEKHFGQSPHARKGKVHHLSLHDLKNYPLRPNAGWDVFDELPSFLPRLRSWYAESGFGIEVQSHRLFAKETPRQGRKLYIELDSHSLTDSDDSNSKVSQDFLNCTESPFGYLLSFMYKPRNFDHEGSVLDDTYGIRVEIDDIPILCRNDNDGGCKVTISTVDMGEHRGWKRFSFRIPNLSVGKHKLSFVGTGPADTFGGLVDRVRLREIGIDQPKVVTALLAIHPDDIVESEAVKLVRLLIKEAYLKDRVSVLRPRADEGLKVLLLSEIDQEHDGSSQFIHNVLEADGHHVVRAKAKLEDWPQSELRYFDVVWYNQPGHPISGADAVDVLEEYRQGIILTGDDASRTTGQATSDMNALTQLIGFKYKNNGTSVKCASGKTYGIDNSANQNRYVLKSHLVGWKDLNIHYGDDIDHVEPLASEDADGIPGEIYVTATVNQPDCQNVDIPVVFSNPRKRVRVMDFIGD